MSYVIVCITDENDCLEADVFPSSDGLKPSGGGYHLILGNAQDGTARLTASEALRLIGLAIASQLTMGHEIADHAQGAQRLILDLEDSVAAQLVLRFDIGVPKQAMVDALISGGLEITRRHPPGDPGRRPD